jgi:hypothetical protein
MNELDFDPGRFVIVNPIWYVVSRESLESLSTTGPGIAQAKTSDGRWYLPLFTDQDLAERFIQRTGLDGEPIETPLPSNFLNLLEYLERTGHEYTAIDPEPGRPLRIGPISRVIQAVRRSIEQQ